MSILGYQKLKLKDHQRSVQFQYILQDQASLLVKKALTLKNKKNIMKITDGDVNVNIKEIKKPELNSNLVAENIAQQLVKELLTEER